MVGTSASKNPINQARHRSVGGGGAKDVFRRGHFPRIDLPFQFKGRIDGADDAQGRTATGIKEIGMALQQSLEEIKIDAHAQHIREVAHLRAVFIKKAEILPDIRC